MNLLSSFLAAALAVVSQPTEASGSLHTQIEREDLFAFSEPPKVARDGEGWVVTFTSKGRCDATVDILDLEGRIVRHLASGVLGRNAPPPFQRDSLSQRIAWDGLTDDLKKAPDGCRVRVSLGLKPRFDRVLGWSAADAGVAGLAADPNGRLFVLGRVRPGEIVVRAFDREGAYLRTVMPHPASVSPDRMTLVNWTRGTSGQPAINWTRLGGSSQFNLYFNESFCAPPQTPVVTPDGRLVFITDSLSTPREGIGRVLVFVDTRDGAAPGGSVHRLEERAPGEYKFGPLGDAGRPTLGLSPDGKSIYLAGLITRDGKVRRPIHAVYRVPLDKPGLAECFVGQPDSTGTEEGRFNGPRGLACDAAGNLYVADWGNDRLQVFRSDGSFLKSVPCEKPDQVAVHPKTREIYVLSTDESKGGASTLLKLGGLEDSAVRARLDVKQGRFCLDATSDPPAVWVGGQGFMNKTVNGWEGAYGMVWRLLDRGDRFEKVVDLDDLHKRPEGWPAHWPSQTRAYITADPYREELYVRDGNPVFASPILRVDGRSGKVIDKLKPALTARVGPDRRVYLQLYRYGHPGQWLACYDPDTRGYVRFPENASVCPQGKTPQGWEDAPLGPFFIAGARRGFQVQPDVAPNGDIYMPVEIDQNHAAEFERENVAPPARGFRLASGNYLLQVFSPSGRRKSFNILPGLRGAGATPTIATVRVGPTGAVYWAAAFLPLGPKVPDGIAPDADYPNRLWGTLLKFDGGFDRFPVGRMSGSWEDLPENLKATHMLQGFKRGIRVENILWEYPGMSTVNGGCTCMGFSFDLDRFERIYVPAVQTCSVNVLDSNGNLILRVGGYGNADSLGTASPVLDPKTGEIRPRRTDDPSGMKSPLSTPEIGLIQPQYVSATDAALYVVDGWNRRIVRAALDYAAQEVVGLR